MGAGELVRLVLGFSILPLLLHHFAAGRYVYSAFDVTRRYDVVLTVYFSFVPFWGWRQVTVLVIAWTHGCLGVHYWLRARSNYHKFAPVLLTFATLLPVLALLGIWQGTRQILAQWQLHPEWLQMAVGDGHVRDPSVNGSSWNLEVQLYWIYVVLLALVFIAWTARWLVERQHSACCNLRRTRPLYHVPHPRAAWGRWLAASWRFRACAVGSIACRSQCTSGVSTASPQ